MIAVLLVLHIMIAVALVGVILLQKSEGGALGMGGGGMSGFMTGRSTANLLTRTTAGLAAAFFLTSLGLAYLAGGGTARQITEPPAPAAPASSAPAPASSAPAAPAPAAPVAPAPAAPAPPAEAPSK